MHHMQVQLPTQDVLTRRRRRAGDAHAAALEIHSLRGAAGYARLSALQKELEVLEKLADAGDLAAVSKGLQQVEPLLIQSMASLNQWVSRPGND